MSGKVSLAKVVAAGGAAAGMTLAAMSGAGINALMLDTQGMVATGGIQAYTLGSADVPATGLTFTAARNAQGECVATWSGLPAGTKMTVLSVANMTTGVMIANGAPATAAGSASGGSDMGSTTLEIQSGHNGWYSSGNQNATASCAAYSIQDSFNRTGDLDGSSPDGSGFTKWTGTGTASAGTAVIPDGGAALIDTGSQDIRVSGSLGGDGGGAVLITKAEDAQNYVGARVRNLTYTDAGTKSTYNTRKYTYKYDNGSWSHTIETPVTRQCYTGTYYGTTGTRVTEDFPAPTKYFGPYTHHLPLCGSGNPGRYGTAYSTAQGNSGTTTVNGVLKYVNQYGIPVTAVTSTDTIYTYSYGTGRCYGQANCTEYWTSNWQDIEFCDVADSRCQRSYGPYTEIGVRSTTGTQGDYGDTCEASDLCRIDTVPYSNRVYRYAIDLGEKVAGVWATRREFQLPDGVRVESLALANKGKEVSLYYNGANLLGTETFSRINEDSTSAGIGMNGTGTAADLQTGTFTEFGVESNA